jgi:hypothetical protein
LESRLIEYFLNRRTIDYEKGDYYFSGNRLETDKGDESGHSVHPPRKLRKLLLAAFKKVDEVENDRSGADA